MNDRGKRMMVDTIIKLVDSSPSKKFRSYTGQPMSWEITQPELNIWVNYINSTLDILSGYAGLAIISSAKMQVVSIASQGNVSGLQRVVDIERLLLDLALNMLRYLQ